MKSIFLIAAIPLAIAICTVTSARSEQGPSFDCRYANTPDEVVICQNPVLAEDDRRMSGAYFSLRRLAAESGMTGALRELEGTQREWLAARHRCGSDALCLRRAYDARLQDLASMRQAYAEP